MSRIVLVIPCFDEAERLQTDRYLSYLKERESVDFVFVNDGSRDETLELLEHLQQANPSRFSFLHLAQNRGKAEAVRQGVLG